MNSISSLSVLKKPFSWKFTKYHRFQKKIKLQIKQKEDEAAVKDALNMNWEDEPESYTVLEVGTPPDSGIHEPSSQFSWDFDRKRRKDKKSASSSARNKKKDGEESEVDSDLGSEESEGDAVYSTVDDGRSNVQSCRYWSLGPEGPIPVYENAHSKKKLAKKPFYENYRHSSSLSSSDEDEIPTGGGSSGECNADEEVEHIYDYVENVNGEDGGIVTNFVGEDGVVAGLVVDNKSYPVNVFLSLIQGEDNTISPDPNIYEVPPGAILNVASSPSDERMHTLRNITPPNGFKDTLTWGRQQLAKLSLNEKELNSLPIEVIYSSVVKPKRKKPKRRPGLELLTNMASTQENGDAAEPSSETAISDRLEIVDDTIQPKNGKLADEIDETPCKTFSENIDNPQLGETSKVTDKVDRNSQSEELNNALEKSANSNKMKNRPKMKVPEASTDTRANEDEKVLKADSLEIIETKNRKSVKDIAPNGENDVKKSNGKVQEVESSQKAPLDATKSMPEVTDDVCEPKHQNGTKPKPTKVKPSNEAKTKERVTNKDKPSTKGKKGKKPQVAGKNKNEESGKNNDKGLEVSVDSESNVQTQAIKSSEIDKTFECDVTSKSVLKDTSKQPEKVSNTCKVKLEKECERSAKASSEIKVSQKGSSENLSKRKNTHRQQVPSDISVEKDPIRTKQKTDGKPRKGKKAAPSMIPPKDDVKAAQKPAKEGKPKKERLLVAVKPFKKDSDDAAEKDCSMASIENSAEKTSLKANNKTSEPENCTEEIVKILTEEKDAPVAIEISDDGTWGSPFDPKADSLQVETKETEDSKNSDFLNAGLSAEEIKMKHIMMEFGNSYFIQSTTPKGYKAPSNSVRKLQRCSSTESESKSIMNEKLNSTLRQQSEMCHVEQDVVSELDQQESKPEISLEINETSSKGVETSELELGLDAETQNPAEILVKGRKCVLEKTKVRKKKRDSWIKDDDVTLSTDKERRIDHWLTLGVQQLSLPARLTEDEFYDLGMDPSMTEMFLREGEIVYDSIIQNKHKTKTYWEQLMMAAEMGSQPPPLLKHHHHHHHHHNNSHTHTTNGVGGGVTGGGERDRECTINNNNNNNSEKAQSEISENDFYDAESHTSLDSAIDTTTQNGHDHHDHGLIENGLVGPKIVEKVAKKLLEAASLESKPSSLATKKTQEESVIEKEIKQQRERELALIREREAAAAVQKAVKTLGGGEQNILKGDSDEEWRRSRGSCKDEDPFNSIPTTDEGNYSEYGSEGKDDFSPETNNSRVMSPEVEMSGQIHQRTQSMDSMSSGHSSGSGSGLSGSHLDCSYVSINSRRSRGITVKPLDEPEEDNPSTFFRNERETPIEREIRLARDREEELRREKNNNVNNVIKTTESNNNKTVKSPKYSSRDSLNIEKELLIIKSEENIDVQSKVNQLNSLSQKCNSSGVSKKPQPLRLKKHLSKSVANLSCSKDLDSDLLVPSPLSPSLSPAPSPTTTTPTALNSNSHFKKFVATPATSQKKGLMKRFLESRGKLGSTFTLASPTLNSEPIKKLSTFNSSNSNQNTISVVNTSPRTHYVKKAQNKEENNCIGTRPGYKSAEEKIQSELMEMRRREEELRRQRAFSLARSQPNLLSLIDGEGENCLENEKEKEIEVLDRLPQMSKLRTALSNPNLLDLDDKPVQKKFQPKKKSALIAEWENRILKNTE